jgi:hypothetical protein
MPFENSMIGMHGFLSLSFSYCIAGLVATGLPYHLRGSLRLVAHAGASADGKEVTSTRKNSIPPACAEVPSPSTNNFC